MWPWHKIPPATTILTTCHWYTMLRTLYMQWCWKCAKENCTSEWLHFSSSPPCWIKDHTLDASWINDTTMPWHSWRFLHQHYSNQLSCNFVSLRQRFHHWKLTAKTAIMVTESSSISSSDKERHVIRQREFHLLVQELVQIIPWSFWKKF